jgi:uncharacterized protein YggE
MKPYLAGATLFAALCLATPSFAAEPPAPRTVTVTGDADVNVVPDEVNVTFAIETRDKNLAEVKRQNDVRVKNVMAALAAADVQAKDIKTDFLNLQPEYDDGRSFSGRGARNFIGYMQRTTMEIKIRKIASFEPIMTSLLQLGVEYVNGIDFRTSELRKYKDQARAMAMTAAKEKAVALAAVLNEKVGRPDAITEGGGETSYGSRYRAQNSIANASYAGAGDTQENTLSPGTISVHASVKITFELQ